MATAFLPEELEQRHDAVARALVERGFDALLCVRAEAVHWLAGIEPGRDGLPQCLLLEADGRATLITGTEGDPCPAPTSHEHRHWRAEGDCAPQLASLIAERGLRNARVGVDGAPGCTGGAGARYRPMPPADAAHWEDANGLIARHQMIKSAREMAFIRRAAGLADDALDAALTRARPGAWEGDILAAMLAAVLEGGGDPAASGLRIASGDHWLGDVATATRRNLADPDRVALEWSSAYRHYHAGMTRTLQLGDASTDGARLQSVAVDAMAAALEVCTPGTSSGEVYAAHARVVEQAGLRPAWHCGHGVGLQLVPGSIGEPVLARHNPDALAAGMALLLRVELATADGGARFTLGQTVEVTAAGAVSLHRHDPA